jgi:hypothetical protein
MVMDVRLLRSRFVNFRFLNEREDREMLYDKKQQASQGTSG